MICERKKGDDCHDKRFAFFFLATISDWYSKSFKKNVRIYTVFKRKWNLPMECGHLESDRSPNYGTLELWKVKMLCDG